MDGWTLHEMHFSERAYWIALHNSITDWSNCGFNYLRFRDNSVMHRWQHTHTWGRVLAWTIFPNSLGLLHSHLPRPKSTMRKNFTNLGTWWRYAPPHLNAHPVGDDAKMQWLFQDTLLMPDERQLTKGIGSTDVPALLRSMVDSLVWESTRIEEGYVMKF